MPVTQHFAKLLVPPEAAPYELFFLFIISSHCEIIAKHINCKTQDHVGKCSQRKCKHQNECKQRPWYNTTASEISVFLGIVLFIGVDCFSCVENYWSQQPDKSITMPIQYEMTKNRFQQIKRFLKINDGCTELSRLSKGLDWWKKLDPLATDIQAALLEYYLPGDKVSIDEQLIGFSGQSCYTMTISVKKAGKKFKVYSLCQANYLLSFLFALKVSIQKQLFYF